MALSIASLNSGSNGNCYYLANEHDAILVDAGISCRETEKRMARLGLSMNKVRAIFVSHEHADHIRGIPVLARKYNLPVFISGATLISAGLDLDRELVRSFTAHEVVHIGELAVTAFPKFHDAADPHSFIISFNEIRVGVFTDIGYPCEHVIRYFSLCDAAFLEANYDDDLLENGRYPYHLKARIRGDKGHLSNKQAFALYSAQGAHMSHLLLSHLSKDNNCPKIVRELFNSHAGETEIIIASRDQETEICHIRKLGDPGLIKKADPSVHVQFTLF